MIKGEDMGELILAPGSQGMLSAHRSHHRPLASLQRSQIPGAELQSSPSLLRHRADVHSRGAPRLASTSNENVFAVLRSVPTLPRQLCHWLTCGPRAATVSWLQSSPTPSVGKHPSKRFIPGVMPLL